MKHSTLIALLQRELNSELPARRATRIDPVVALAD